MQPQRRAEVPGRRKERIAKHDELARVSTWAEGVPSKGNSRSKGERPRKAVPQHGAKSVQHSVALLPVCVPKVSSESQT